MFNVRLAGGHLYGKQLFTWLSLVVSFMASFVLSFFPLDVLDGIWYLIESVSEGFLTCSSVLMSNITQNSVKITSQISQFVVRKGKNLLVFNEFHEATNEKWKHFESVYSMKVLG